MALKLCDCCKKNTPVFSYERKTVDGVKKECYCIVCNDRYFLSVGVDSSTDAHDACPYCGTTAENLQKQGMAGCPHCYTALQGAAVQTVVRMQQGDVDAHRGKVFENEKKRATAERRLEELAAIEEYYRSQGNAIVAERYLESERLLRKQLETGEYDGI